MRGCLRRAIRPILALAGAVLFCSANLHAQTPSPQWRSDRQNTEAVFTYLGYRIGQSLDAVKAQHGPFPYAKQVAPNAVLYADTNGVGYPLLTEFFFVDDHLSALKATFDNGMTQPGEIDYMLQADYGPPSASEIVEWVDRFGHLIRSRRETWQTPAGALQFDERFGRLNTGTVQVNPDLIEKLTQKNGL